MVLPCWSTISAHLMPVCAMHTCWPLTLTLLKPSHPGTCFSKETRFLLRKRLFGYVPPLTYSCSFVMVEQRLQDTDIVDVGSLLALAVFSSGRCMMPLVKCPESRLVSICKLTGFLKISISQLLPQVKCVGFKNSNHRTWISSAWYHDRNHASNASTFT